MKRDGKAARLIQTGQVLRYIPPIEYAAGIDQEREKLAAIAKALNIQPGQ